MVRFTTNGHEISIFNVRRGLDEGYMARCRTCDSDKIAGPTTMTLIRRQIDAHTRVAPKD